MALFDADRTSGSPPVRVAFDAGRTFDPDDQELSYVWSFGDGATATGETVEHVFAAAGEYEVRLTVTDADGLESVATQAISVEAPSGSGSGGATTPPPTSGGTLPPKPALLERLKLPRSITRAAFRRGRLKLTIDVLADRTRRSRTEAAAGDDAAALTTPHRDAIGARGPISQRRGSSGILRGPSRLKG